MVGSGIGAGERRISVLSGGVGCILTIKKYRRLQSHRTLRCSHWPFLSFNA